MARERVKKEKINRWLSVIHAPAWLCVILLFVFIFRIPSFFEPFSYGDEMIYLDLGHAVRRGLTLYKNIHDNKPPLLYFTAAIAGNVFWFRAILAIWMMITTIIFWRLAEQLFPKNLRVQKIATVTFAIFTTLPLLEGQTANAELFMIGPTMLSFLLIYNSRKVSPTKLFLSGLLFSVALHFKVPAIFEIGAVFFLWLLTFKLTREHVVDFVVNTFYFMSGLFSLVLVFLIWYGMKGALGEYFTAAFLQNMGYLSSWRPDSKVDPFIVRNLPLIIRSVIVLVGLGFLYIFRHKLNKNYIFLTAWTLFALFGVTLSERPYPHYLIQVVPPMSLLIGQFFAGRTVEQSLTVIPLFLTVLTPIYFNFWHYKSIPYYQNFIEFAVGKKDKQQYLQYFGENTVRNYEVAKFIIQNSKSDDYVFVWGGDASTIYALSKRLPPIKYVASYHIKDFSSSDMTIAELQSNKPELIILLPDGETLPGLRGLIDNNYYELQQIQGVQVYKHSESISRLLQEIEWSTPNELK